MTFSLSISVTEAVDCCRSLWCGFPLLGVHFTIKGEVLCDWVRLMEMFSSFFNNRLKWEVEGWGTDWDGVNTLEIKLNEQHELALRHFQPGYTFSTVLNVINYICNRPKSVTVEIVVSLSHLSFWNGQTRVSLISGLTNPEFESTLLLEWKTHSFNTIPHSGIYPSRGIDKLVKCSRKTLVTKHKLNSHK